MNALERITRILSKISKEKESLSGRISEYIQIEETAKIKEEHNKSLKQLLVVSEHIADELGKHKDPSNKLSPEEKTEAILLLNKRLSQVNNTREKTEMIAHVIISYKNQKITQDKTGAYTVLIIRRLVEQIKAQVSTNKESAVGYAYLLSYLSHEIGDILERYKYIMYSSMLPLDCLLGMYRVYFVFLKNTENLNEAWLFISSLLNYIEEINSTFNPSVLLVFLDSLNGAMGTVFNNSWGKILEYIRTKYLPLVDDRYKTEIQQIKSIIR
ncbi:hypothetical protein NEMIN01_2428 [Nematocida minor]|uniref:uncharacterized protein n=1 Tax=Nematocida minor TaxID=1912983 RepID=UPI00221F5007|nr:uncharacterized protein NEMIN01_2428 [Nematocida minor]KAI5193231.1 hypothetical protein NEMIN01_2428 [Nematocida minor]